MSGADLPRRVTRPASTYPELMAETDRWPLAERRALAAGYELAEAMSSGIERAHGQSLATHLVRTASICAAHGGEAVVATAAIVHAAYLLDRFTVLGDARPRRALRRDEVRDVVGADAERIVHAYVASMPFDREIDVHLAACPDWDDDQRRAGLIHLANTLDDHLDGAASWAAVAPVLTPAHGELARRLGHPELADDLDETLVRDRSVEVPDQLRRPHTRGYVVAPMTER